MRFVAVGKELQPGGVRVHHLRRQRRRHRPPPLRSRGVLRGVREAVGGERREGPDVQGQNDVLRQGGTGPVG